MASIATSIQIYDRVSAPINNIITALDNMCSAYESVENSMKDGFDTKAIQNARQAIDSAAKQTVELGNNQEDYNERIRQGASAADGLTNKIMGAVGAYASLQGMQKLVNLSDEYTQTKARLNMIVDDGGSVDELEDKIFASAQRSRASYSDTADAVAKFSLRAGDAFSSNDEVIAFTETLNKMYAIAGTAQSEMSGATLQLTQALGSGVLRGQEFNAVFEAAPNVMQAVADYMDVPIGKLRGMAEEGQITADVVKNALLGASGEINGQFESMPMTWGQVWTGVMNELYMASIPVLNAISWMAQNWSVLEPIVIGLATAVGLYVAALLIYNTIQGISNIITSAKAAAEMMSTGATFAATAAQHGFNAALLACPLTWILLIILLVIVAIYAVVAAINKVTGSTVSATGVIVGAIMAAVAFIWNLFLGLVDLVLGCVNALVNPWLSFANFFANVFNDPIASIIHLFGDLADNVLGVIETIAKAIDKVFGSNLAGTVQGWRSGLDSMVEEAANKHGNGSYEKVADNLNLSSESLGLKRWEYGDAYNTGYKFGESVDSKVGDMFGGGATDDPLTPSNIAETAENTGATADALEVSSEDLKYLRDIAERDVVNRFTTAEIKVDMTNNNNVSSSMDVDGIVDQLTSKVNEAMEMAAEGVHE